MKADMTKRLVVAAALAAVAMLGVGCSKPKARAFDLQFATDRIDGPVMVDVKGVVPTEAFFTLDHEEYWLGEDAARDDPRSLVAKNRLFVQIEAGVSQKVMRRNDPQVEDLWKAWLAEKYTHIAVRAWVEGTRSDFMKSELVPIMSDRYDKDQRTLTFTLQDGSELIAVQPPARLPKD